MRQERKETASRGRLEAIVGPMFGGKTEELIRRARRAVIAKQEVQVFKPQIDTRYSEDKVNSHSGVEWEAEMVEQESPSEILERIKPETQVVGIDEVQFFNEEIINVCEELVAQGKRVIIAGLPTDFRNEPFGPTPRLMALAEEVDRFPAVCMVCGDEAHFTQRFIDGMPARWDDPVVVVGGDEMYTARCREHHEVPGRPRRRKHG